MTLDTGVLFVFLRHVDVRRWCSQIRSLRCVRQAERKRTGRGYFSHHPSIKTRVLLGG
ncbi:MAG: hypothetical protein M3R15_34205 [Acidobacteriota bacterium]|nr:hypothetical protein [Acidobacteriota bacterium]